MAEPSTPARRRPPFGEEFSAGGFVLDRLGAGAKAALIARHDRRGRLVWSLPKGHIEAGETPQEAAVREVFEETGIRGSIVASLGTIDFWFMSESRRVHKTVHHYLLSSHGGELSDADPEVAEVEWVALDDAAERLGHADERKLVDRVRQILADGGHPA